MAEEMLDKISIVPEKRSKNKILAHERLEVVNQEQDLGQSGRILRVRDQMVSGQRQVTQLTKTLLSLADAWRSSRGSWKRRKGKIKFHNQFCRKVSLASKHTFPADDQSFKAPPFRLINPEHSEFLDQISNVSQGFVFLSFVVVCSQGFRPE